MKQLILISVNKLTRESNLNGPISPIDPCVGHCWARLATLPNQTTGKYELHIRHWTGV